jgi:DNA-directed RNA polymerase beta subunit
MVGEIRDIETGEISIKARKENSSTIRQEEQGTIDDVFITIDTEGNKIIQVRTRDTRFPELGDKYSTSHGQKGVIGAIVPEDDLPFTSSGIRPDILFNPQSIPSRMTVGYLIELLAGKIGCLNGKVVDATPFTKLKIEDLEKELLELGFSPDGKETLYHGITGKPLEAKIYVGNMYYLKLKYMVANKIHARASGKVTLLTRQPVEGRSKGGALRLGEMEQQTFVAHGSSLLLKERFDSDKVVLLICDECGSIAIRDKIHKRNICPICSQNSKLHAIEVSYAFKLLIEELMSLHIFPHLILKDKFAQN